MIYQSPKQYKNYRFNTRAEAYAELRRGPPNKERAFMHKMLVPIVDYLENKGVEEYQDFIKIFKECGLMMNDVRKYIDGFRNFINSLDESLLFEKINWINNRELAKSNSGEKNLMLNRLSFQYPKEMLLYAQQFIQIHAPKIFNEHYFVQNFETKIQRLIN